MLHTRVRTQSQIVRDVPPEQLHALAEDKANLLWIDLEAPNADEVGLIAGIFGWSPLTVEDLIKQGQRAKLEDFGGYTYLVMHDLVYGAEAKRVETPEVDFVIGDNYVASVHYHQLPHVNESREVAQHLAALLANGPDYLLYVLIDRLVDGYFPALDDMHEAVEDLEQSIISDPGPHLLPRIFEMKRDAVTLRRVISPQMEVFSRLTSPGFGVVTEPHVVYFRDVHDHLIRCMEGLDTYRDLMSGALDAYLSNVSNRMNEVMKRLTVLAALFLPITFFTGLLGMNLRVVPLWQDNLFWVLLVIMATVSAMQLLYFRKKGWT